MVLRQVGYQANRIAERLLATLNSLPGMEECLEHVLQTPSLHNQEIVLEDRVVDNFAIDLTLNSSKRRAMRLFLTTVTCKFNDMCYYRRLTTSLEKVILFLSRDPEGTSLIKSILISYMPPPDNNYLSERVVNNLALEWVKKPEMAEQLHLLIKKRHVDLATATLFQLSFQQPADSQISALIKKTLDARLQTNEHI